MAESIESATKSVLIFDVGRLRLGTEIRCFPYCERSGSVTEPTVVVKPSSETIVALACFRVLGGGLRSKSVHSESESSFVRLSSRRNVIECPEIIPSSASSSSSSYSDGAERIGRKGIRLIFLLIFLLPLPLHLFHLLSLFPLLPLPLLFLLLSGSLSLPLQFEPLAIDSLPLALRDSFSFGLLLLKPEGFLLLLPQLLLLLSFSIRLSISLGGGSSGSGITFLLHS